MDLRALYATLDSCQTHVTYGLLSSDECCCLVYNREVGYPRHQDRSSYQQGRETSVLAQHIPLHPHSHPDFMVHDLAPGKHSYDLFITPFSPHAKNSQAISASTLFSATILMLKLISYALVNADMRRETALKIIPKRCEEPSSKDAQLQNDDGFDVEQTPYPSNITLGNLLYFVFCPTLVMWNEKKKTSRTCGHPLL